MIHESAIILRSLLVVSQCPHNAPVAQLDRASAFEAAGRRFESCRAYHIFNRLQTPKKRYGKLLLVLVPLGCLKLRPRP